MFADYSWFTSYLDKLMEITPADVQRAAQTFFRPQSRVVGTYLPVAEGGDE
jgi:predicted Zn-dependent peptidase